MGDDGRPPDVEWLDDGEEPLPPHQPRHLRRWPWWAGAAALAVAALVVTLVVQPGGHQTAAPTPSTRSSTAPSATPPDRSSSTPRATPTPTRTVSVRTVGHPLLGVTAGWELFGYGPRTLVRIQLTAGRITRTIVPRLSSDAPVSLAATPHTALIRPWNRGPGYVVPDGKPASELPGGLARGGPLLPGPAPGQFWAQDKHDSNDLTLVGLDGKRVGSAEVTIHMPDGVGYPPLPDGHGYLAVSAVGGTYDARPGGWQRITTGQLLAIGPTRWLAQECDASYHCSRVVIDRGNGVRHVLGPASGTMLYGNVGVISPDGSTAALTRTDEAGNLVIHLVDLASGRDRALPIHLDTNNATNERMVFSPDSRWLLAVDWNGHLHIFDAGTGQAQRLGVPLPDIGRLAVRPAPA